MDGERGPRATSGLRDRVCEVTYSFTLDHGRLMSLENDFFKKQIRFSFLKQK